jgi:hypothetical protein
MAILILKASYTEARRNAPSKWGCAKEAVEPSRRMRKTNCMSNPTDIFDLEEYAHSNKTVPPHARHFRIRVDESTLEITTPNPTGREILAKVGKSPDAHFLTQILVGEDDIVVEPDERVNLLRPGIERFTVVAKPCEVIVNTRSRPVHGETLTFEQIVCLAFGTSADNETSAYTVVYRNGDPSKPEGSVVKGGSVKVRCGMIIDVDRTDRS